MRFFLLLVVVGLFVPVDVVLAGDWSLDLGDSEFPLTPNEELEKQNRGRKEEKKRPKCSNPVWTSLEEVRHVKQLHLA